MSTKVLSRCLGPALIALTLALFTFVSGLFGPQTASAVPSFARQTGMACIACHTEYPILTEYGRQFKLGGYTMAAGDSNLPPIAFMFLPGFTQTNKGQPDGAAPRFGKNSNFALSQGSIFYAGRLFGPYTESLFGATAATFLNKFGTFSQVTYDGVARRLSWDNVEFRFADTATIGGQSLTYGFYLNNNPGLQDVWNTTPVWGFPFSSSPLAPTPGSDTLINGGLSQQVIGAGAYVMLANSLYLDIAAYHTPSTSFQRAMGVAPEGQTQIPGLAPYWRLAYTKSVGNQSFEVGLFGLAARTYPGRDKSAGKDRLVDWGFDSQYQASFGKHDITALFSAIYEQQNWNATQQLGGATNKSNHLWSTKVTVDYLYDKIYGAAVGYFYVNGNRDPLLYAANTNGSPLSDGVIFQLNY